MRLQQLRQLAPVGVLAMGSFLAFTSQWLFLYIEPGPLARNEMYTFNALVLISFLCFIRTSATDPGRIPSNWHESLSPGTREPQVSRQRWCRKCETYKPPRAHHCKTCQRCIVKMDHHCVWTANCISHVTFPHFVRYLVYGVAAMSYLEYFICQRCAVLWQKRRMPSYLGPNGAQLAHMFVLVGVNSLILFGVFLLLARTLWSLLFNTTTIESWEVERHETLLRRARVLGGFLPGPDGSRVAIEHQEFPWDIGLWANISQGMGSRNPLSWLWPLARSPTVTSGLTFEHNEIEDPSKPWPPPDPDRLFRAPRRRFSGDGFTHGQDAASFRQRQAADSFRFADTDGEFVIRRRPFHERLEASKDCAGGPLTGTDARDTATDHTHERSDSESISEQDALDNHGGGGEEAWRNSEGERLADFGVDEVADFYDEDDVPLGELRRRLKANGSG